MKKKKIIFVCIHNSSRSQMAEGILRHLYGESYEVYSAGTLPTLLHPLAVTAMKEIGIDISMQKSKGFDAFKGMEFDLVVTVCGPLASCPYVAGAKETIHREFDDPAVAEGIELFRRVRDEIYGWIKDAFKNPNELPKSQLIPLHLS